MTSKLTSRELTSSTTISSRTANRIIFAFLLAILGIMLFGAPLSAQTYSCFPTCSTTDGRFLTVAGSGYNTLINSEIVLKFGSPGVSSTMEIGIFDGETGGMWDRGTTGLQYRLYADPTGAGTGTHQVANWSASQMVDNGWATFVVTNVTEARSPNGNYLYRLVVNSSSGNDNYWSSFKVRTTGTVALKPQAFSICATANTDQDLNVLYPAGLDHLDSTTYDGTWSFFLDVPLKASSISVWDGDMDFGSYDCSVSDVDDLNTPNNILPEWASAQSANPEGVGTGSPCVGTSGYSTGAPPDDNRYPTFRRSPSVYYQIVSPQGQVYTNSNPSGGGEWEEFKISTGALDRNLNDAHADSLPAGRYELRVIGMDLGNLNAWRFYSDAIGVDQQGEPVQMVRAYAIAGNINYGSTATSGTASTTTTNGRSNSTTTTSSSSSTTLANIQVTLYGDLNGDNITDITLTTTTDQNGNYSFPNLAPGTYTISVATTTLPAGSICTDDYDGATTPNSATTTVVASTSNPAPVNFSYRISSSGTSTGGTRTQGYWKTHASEWTCTSIRVGCTTYSREQAIAIMDASVRGDMTYAMFEQLVAAKLNVAGGSYASCILSTISAAETWLCAHPVGSNVGSSSSAWTSGADDLHEMLDDYNNGRLCAPHVN